MGSRACLDSGGVADIVGTLVHRFTVLVILSQSRRGARSLKTACVDALGERGVGPIISGEEQLLASSFQSRRVGVEAEVGTWERGILPGKVSV